MRHIFLGIDNWEVLSRDVGDSQGLTVIFVSNLVFFSKFNFYLYNFQVRILFDTTVFMGFSG